MPRQSKAKQQSSQAIGVSVDWNFGSQQNLEMFPQKSGRELLRDLKKMVSTDETVGSAMWCIRTVLTSLPWKHKAQVNGKDTPADPQAQKAADFADTLLDDMDISWAEHVEEAATMIWAGFAPCEIITKQRDGFESNYSDYLWGVRHLPLRDPATIVRVEYENNDRTRPVAFVQMGVGGSALLPMWKVVNYRMDAHLDSPWGTPLFENAVRPWQFKMRGQESEAVGIERDLCGIPVFRVPLADMEKAGETEADGVTPTAEALIARQRIANAQKAVRDMRFNRSAGLVIPSDSFYDEVDGDRTLMYDFKLVTSAGQRSIDVRSAIRDYDRAIARVVLMQFLHLGDRSSGSYALSDDQSSLAIGALKAIARKIADAWRKKVLRLVWTVNGMDMKYLPRLEPGEVSKEGLTAIGTFLRGVGAVLPLVQEDPKARESVLAMAGMDNDRETQTASAARQVETADAAAELAANPPPPQTAPPPGPKPANDSRGSG